jgi:simple sugar transport system ATP-binding protein
MSDSSTILLEARGISKFYGKVVALDNVSLVVRSGEVTCLLGDNGAGKSTLIQLLAGVLRPDKGEILSDGRRVEFSSPAQAIDRGIATVFQDLAVVPIMPVYRNFVLGRETMTGFGPFKRFDRKAARELTATALERIGVAVEDVNRPLSTLSGGERQCVAIARAVHFGARVLILDEPTSALGVREAEVVLNYIGHARELGIGIVLITHNAHHAYPVGDRFVILRRGSMEGQFEKSELTAVQLVRHMAGGAELDRLEADLARNAGEVDAQS